MFFVLTHNLILTQIPLRLKSLVPLTTSGLKTLSFPHPARSYEDHLYLLPDHPEIKNSKSSGNYRNSNVDRTIQMMINIIATEICLYNVTIVTIKMNQS